MGGCFSCQRCRSSYKQDTRLPETKEKEMEKPLEADSEAHPAAPTSPPAAGGAWSCSILSSDDPAGLAAPVPESVPEAALTLDVLEQHLAALKELQGQYLQGQRRVRRTCQHFPRSLRAISLQICHARRRLVRIEVRLKRREGEEGLSALPAKPILPTASASRGLISVGSSISSFSLPLPHLSPPLPSPPPSCPDLGDLKETLETLVQLQAHHIQERKRDLRGCQECLTSLRALRGQLRHIRNRLWVLEERLGIQVPPRELDADAQEEEREEPETPLGVLDTHGGEQEERGA